MFEHGQKCRLGQYYGRNMFTRPAVTLVSRLGFDQIKLMRKYAARFTLRNLHLFESGKRLNEDLKVYRRQTVQAELTGSGSFTLTADLKLGESDDRINEQADSTRSPS